MVCNYPVGINERSGIGTHNTPRIRDIEVGRLLNNTSDQKTHHIEFQTDLEKEKRRGWEESFSVRIEMPSGRGSNFDYSVCLCGCSL